MCVCVYVRVYCCIHTELDSNSVWRVRLVCVCVCAPPSDSDSSLVWAFVIDLLHCTAQPFEWAQCKLPAVTTQYSVLCVGVCACARAKRNWKKESAMYLQQSKAGLKRRRSFLSYPCRFACVCARDESKSARAPFQQGRQQQQTTTTTTAKWNKKKGRTKVNLTCCECFAGKVVAFVACWWGVSGCAGHILCWSRFTLPLVPNWMPHRRGRGGGVEINRRAQQRPDKALVGAQPRVQDHSCLAF